MTDRWRCDLVIICQDGVSLTEDRGGDITASNVSGGSIPCRAPSAERIGDDDRGAVHEWKRSGRRHAVGAPEPRREFAVRLVAGHRRFDNGGPSAS
jgi:hypothetical protein